MKKNPYEMLLDENNNDNVIFYDDNGNKMEFEQVALIPLNDENYVILHPLNMGYGEDDAIAYSLICEGNNYELLEVLDDDLLDEIYHEYKKLFNKKRL